MMGSMSYRLPGQSDAEEGVERKERRRRAARKTLSTLPTLCTLCNLLAGFASIFMASRDPVDMTNHWSHLTYAVIFIFVGMGMDGLDGWVARKTRSTSSLGEQLDSMADMVTFGAAPAFLAIQLVGVQTPFLSDHGDTLFNRFALIVALIYVACAALRLARFNIQVHLPSESDHGSFKGLPSPGAAGTVASLALLHEHFMAHPTPGGVRAQAAAVGMVCIMLLVAIAMVSRLRYVHVVNRYLRGRVRFTRMTAGIIIVMLAVVWLQASLAAAFAIYALSAPTMWLLQLATGRKPASAGIPAQPPASASAPTDSTPRTGT